MKFTLIITDLPTNIPSKLVSFVLLFDIMKDKGICIAKEEGFDMSDHNVVQIGRLKLGDGITKVAVPITGATQMEILEQADKVKAADPDLIEWRIDFFEDVTNFEKLNETADGLRKTLGDVPLLTTFRTKAEGGELALKTSEYFAICKQIIGFDATDAIDIEWNHPADQVKEILDLADEMGIVTIMSNHNFQKTPAKEVIVKRLSDMQSLGADVAKIAVMPNSSTDVITLLEATNEASQTLHQPIITMSMGNLGKISRVSGNTFGSSLTFASVGKTSAPGQIPLTEMKKILTNI